MKKSITIVLALVAIAALSGLGSAQQQQDRPQEGRLENLPELRSIQTFEPGVAPKCPKPPVVYSGGLNDGFALPNDPVTLCPALAAFLGAHPPTRRFDQLGPDMLFGYSFRIRECCKVCAVQFEVRMRAAGTASDVNDKIHIYGNSITPSDLIWTAPTGVTGTGAPGTTILTAYLPPASIKNLNDQIFKSCPGLCLNILAQDDHAIDYVKLTIWSY